MLDAIYTSFSGLQGQQQRLDAISNNLANVNTPAFKKTRVNFADFLYRPAGTAADAAPMPSAMLGLGSRVSGLTQVFSQGDLRQTDRPLDIAIQGPGFLEVQRADGSLAYTRLGALRLNELGELVTQGGLTLSGAVRVPPDATAISIAPNGEVSARVPDEDRPVLLGALELASFINPEALRPLGDGLYTATSESGVAFYAAPGEQGLGRLQQGFVEAANVDFVEELTELTMAQRAYQLNARVLQAGDEILAEINELRR